MIKENVINNPNLLGVGVAQYLRVSRRCPTWDENSIFLLEIYPILFLGLDLIDLRSSCNCKDLVKDFVNLVVVKTKYKAYLQLNFGGVELTLSGDGVGS